MKNFMFKITHNKCKFDRKQNVQNKIKTYF